MLELVTSGRSSCLLGRMQGELWESTNRQFASPDAARLYAPFFDGMRQAGGLWLHWCRVPGGYSEGCPGFGGRRML